MPRVLIPYRQESKLKPYAHAARAGGLEPVALSIAQSPSLEGAHALMLMGGTDVNPERYGEAPAPETDHPLDDERDSVELHLLRDALSRDMPILAICRGLQILNVYCGGTLAQHLGSERHDPELPDKSESAHEIAIEPESLLARIAEAENWSVNSRHHQAVKTVGENLRISARDAVDGTIEGLEMPGRRFVVAVQWHPEDQITRFPEQVKLFSRFAEACG